jgi:hypothetical protein
MVVISMKLSLKEQPLPFSPYFYTHKIAQVDVVLSKLLLV